MGWIHEIHRWEITGSALCCRPATHWLPDTHITYTMIRYDYNAIAYKTKLMLCHTKAIEATSESGKSAITSTIFVVITNVSDTDYLMIACTGHTEWELRGGHCHRRTFVTGPADSCKEPWTIKIISIKCCGPFGCRYASLHFTNITTRASDHYQLKWSDH